MIRLGSLAGYPFEGPRRARRLDAAGRPAVYAIMYKPEPDTKPAVRGDLRRPLRRPVGRAVPVPAPAVAVLDPAGRQPVEGLHLHRTRCPAGWLAPGADRQELTAIYQPRLQRAAVRPDLEGRVDRRVHAPTTGPLTTGTASADPERRALASTGRARRAWSPGGADRPSQQPGAGRVARRGPAGRRAPAGASGGCGVTPVTMPSAMP